MKLFFKIIGILTWVIAFIVGVGAVFEKIKKNEYTDCDLEEKKDD